jgi:hypothetical protein
MAEFFRQVCPLSEENRTAMLRCDNYGFDPNRSKAGSKFRSAANP